jgi:hypothetical protein
MLDQAVSHVCKKCLAVLVGAVEFAVSVTVTHDFSPSLCFVRERLA